MNVDEQQFLEEFKELESRELLMRLTAMQAWSVLSSIQLACRHPKFCGPTRQIAEEVARTIQGAIAPSGALAQVAAAGWETEVGTFHQIWQALIRILHRR